MALVLLGGPLARDAAAQCMPSANGVTCTGGEISAVGTDAIGLEVAGDARLETNGTDVRVQGSSATGLIAERVTRRGGAMRVEGAGARGSVGRWVAHVGDGTTVRVEGAGAAAMEGERVDSVNAVLAIGDGVRAVIANKVTNVAPLDVRGDGAIGLLIGPDTTYSPGILSRNLGMIRVQGRDAIGIQIGDPDGFRRRQLGLSTVNVLGPAPLIDASAAENGIGVLVGRGAFFENEATIRGGTGDGAAIAFLEGAETVENLPGGLLSGANGVAVRGSSDSDLLINRGDIEGDVVMGGGGVALYPGATIDGRIEGGSAGVIVSLSADEGCCEAAFDLDDLDVVDGLALVVSGLRGFRFTLTGSIEVPTVILRQTTRLGPGTTLVAAVEARLGSGRFVELGDGVTITGGLDVPISSSELRLGANAEVRADIYSASASSRFVLRGRNRVEGLVDLGQSSDQEGVVVVPIAATGTTARLDVEGELHLGTLEELRLLKVDGAPFAGETTYVRVLAASEGISGKLGSVTVYERDCAAGCVDVPVPGVTATATYRGGDNLPRVVDVTVTAP